MLTLLVSGAVSPFENIYAAFVLQGALPAVDVGWLKLCSAFRHESGVRGSARVQGAVAALSGREPWLVHLQVLAGYRGLGLATLEEHVLVQGQPHVVLGSGAHSVFTGDLWNE